MSIKVTGTKHLTTSEHTTHLELPPYQLPPGWNADPNSYALTYKHKQKPGKQFMLTVREHLWDFKFNITFLLRLSHVQIIL